MNGRTSVHASGLATLAVLGFLASAGIASYVMQPAIAFVRPHPGFYADPAIVSVQVRVPRHADNRRVYIWWDEQPCNDMTVPCGQQNSCTAAGGFTVQVDGEQSGTILPRNERRLRLIGACPYLFVAELLGVGDELRARAVTRVDVR